MENLYRMRPNGGRAIGSSVAAAASSVLTGERGLFNVYALAVVVVEHGGFPWAAKGLLCRRRRVYQLLLLLE
jgi:hypothetical protein